MAVFYETHAHLDYPDFAADLPDVIERAGAAGIRKLITIGTDFASSARALALAEQYPVVYAAVGWHPNEAGRAPEDARPELRRLASHPKAVAIGETGLDFYRRTEGAAEPPAELKERQGRLFGQHLEIAAELGLNCIIHQRDAFEPALGECERWAGKVRSVFHCFVGDRRAMERVLGIGGLVSFTGIITFKNAAMVRETVQAAPLRGLMLETDCPFLAPVPYRGGRCEPAYVRQVAETVAQLKACSLDELSQTTCATAEEFFPKLA